MFMQCVCCWPLKKLYGFPFQFPIAIKEHVCLFVQKTSATLPNSRLCMIGQMQDITSNAEFKAHLGSLSSADTAVYSPCIQLGVWQAMLVDTFHMPDCASTRSLISCYQLPPLWHSDKPVLIKSQSGNQIFCITANSNGNHSTN